MTSKFNNKQKDSKKNKPNDCVEIHLIFPPLS